MVWLPETPPMPVGEDWPAEPGWIIVTLKHPGLLAEKPEVMKLTPNRLIELEMANRQVNEAIKYEHDPNDIWRVVDLTEKKPRGDCEDYVLTKRELLIGKGWERGSLRPAKCVVTKDKKRHVHLVLVAVTDIAQIILDNLLYSLGMWDRLPYRWVSREVPGRDKWELIKADGR